MDTIFKPKPELFRPCCGHCAYSRKIGKRYLCEKTKDAYTYSHICKETGTDDGEQIEMSFDKCDGTVDLTTDIPEISFTKEE